MNAREDILDLRTALEVLRGIPGQLLETDVEVYTGTWARAERWSAPPTSTAPRCCSTS